MSRRSLLSAAVVPTATDEQLEDDDELVQTVETDEQLDIELSESTSSPTPATMMRVGVSDNPATVVDSVEQQLPTAGPVPSRPLRTQSDVGSGAKLVKNYRGIVSSFKYLKPFTRGPDGKYPDKIVCVLCAAAKPSSVFFPCQHMCVCNKCIDENDMTPAYSMSLERCVCPVCREPIRLILPHTGEEEDKYWHWVQQTESTLSVEFRNGFKMAGRRLSDSSVTSSVSTIGSHLAKDDTRPLETSARAYRRGSWAPSSRVISPKLGATKKQESCLIL